MPSHLACNRGMPSASNVWIFRPEQVSLLGKSINATCVCYPEDSFASGLSIDQNILNFKINLEKDREAEVAANLKSIILQKKSNQFHIALRLECHEILL